jgi:RNA polymerase sigma factor (sigma-70 family)
MSTAQRLTVLQHLRRLAASCPSTALSDGQLLEQFRLRQDEPAFEALLSRHGPMVLALCRRLLPNLQDAEDAFQATFLVLVCQAGAVAKRDSVGSWLYGVAYRIALRAKVRGKRLRVRDVPEDLADPKNDAPSDLLMRREILAALDEEINRLPEKHRGPLVLCCLEGAPQEEAARRLGWSLGTLRRRLQRGRALLRARLEYRGVTLGAALAAACITEGVAPAAVPAGLAATTLKSTMLVAAGKIMTAATTSAQAVALSKSLLRAFWLAKLKTAATAVFAVAALGVGVGLATYSALDQDQAPAVKPTAQMKSSRESGIDSSDAQRAPLDREESKQKTVAVRIVNTEGTPLTGAEVTAIGRSLGKQRIRQWGDAPEVLGAGRSDQQGNFSFTLPGAANERFFQLFVVARKDKHGLGYQGIDRAAPPSAVEIRLPHEQVRRVRLVTLQGLPSAGVAVRLSEVHSRSQEFGSYWSVGDRFLGKGAALWPGPMVSDSEGRFVVHGVGPDDVPKIEVADPRFASHAFEIKSNGKDQAQEIALVLTPGRTLQGRITYSDTGKPAPGVRVLVQARPDLGFLMGGAEPIECRTDADGKYRATPQVGNWIDVAAYPSAGEPYLFVHKLIEWPKTGQIAHKVDLALFRGVRVTGTIAEQPSGKPIAGASIEYRWRRSHNPYYRSGVDETGLMGVRDAYPISDAKGRFEMIVPPGPSHLLVKGDTLEYLHSEIPEHELSGPDTRPDRRYYPDGLAALDLKPGDDARDVTIALRRGVTRTGTLIGPDGKLVEHGVMACRSYIPYGFDRNKMSSVQITDGRFSLPGCDPDKPVEVFVYSLKSGVGARTTLEGKPHQPVTIRLQPFGKAKARFVDEEGKPVAKVWPLLNILVTPGVVFANNFDVKGVEAECIGMMNLDPGVYNGLRSDEQGQATFPSLLPGAAYLLLAQGLGRGTTDLKKKFKVDPGQTLDLGDVIWPSRP